MNVRGRKAMPLAAIATGAIGVLSLTVGGIGVATAANGGSLILGHANTASATTTLSNSTGTPLSLNAKKGHAPLAVNSSKLVKHLNAALLGGHSAASLRARGSAAGLRRTIDGPRVGVLLPVATQSSPSTLHPVVVASTAKLAAGTYEVTATAMGGAGFCWIASTAAIGAQQYGVLATTLATTSETRALHVKKNKRAREYCVTPKTGTAGTAGGAILSAGITAVAVSSSTTGKAPTPVPLPITTVSPIAQP